MILPKRFENKVVVVTGGTTGIGRATVERLMIEGAKVFVLDIARPEYELVNQSHFILCDVGDIGSIQKSIAEVVQLSHGRIDACFSNAGVHFFGSIEDTSIETFNRVLNINFTGTFFLMKEIIPIMKVQPSGGAVVLMGSDQSYVGKGQSSIYGATKGAVGQLTKSLAIDYAASNIRVNCICPGTINTPLLDHAVETFSKKSGLDKDVIHQSLATAQPIRRLGQPSEVAAMVAFLLSGEASFMTGALVSVDGGYVAQ